MQNTVTNYTLRDTEYRLRAAVGVSYDSDVDAVLRVLLAAAHAFPHRLPSHEPRVLLTDFGDSALMFEVLVWVRDPWRARALKSELNLAIWWALKRAALTIPFPQRDLHLVSAPGLALATAVAPPRPGRATGNGVGPDGADRVDES